MLHAGSKRSANEGFTRTTGVEGPVTEVEISAVFQLASTVASLQGPKKTPLAAPDVGEGEGVLPVFTGGVLAPVAAAVFASLADVATLGVPVLCGWRHHRDRPASATEATPAPK